MNRLWLGLCFACLIGACAQGYEADPAVGLNTLRQPETAVPRDSGPPPAPDAARPYTGEACSMGDTAVCTCQSTGTEGMKVCQRDPASPTDGTFSECRNCADPGGPGDVPEPDAGMEPGAGGPSCADGEQNGTETDVDCGGGSCPSCLLGRGCQETSDCSAGECVSGVCERPGGGDSPGGGGSSCQPACSQPCFPVGVLPCCNALGRCGCTWAPGAYCL